MIVADRSHPEFAQDLSFFAEQAFVETMIEKNDLSLIGFGFEIGIHTNVNIARMRIGVDEASAKDLFGKEANEFLVDLKQTNGHWLIIVEFKGSSTDIFQWEIHLQ